MYIILAVLIGMALGFIRRGSIRAITEHPYKNWAFGAVGIIIEILIHLYCFLPTQIDIAQYLPILNFVGYLLIFITLIYNLDDIYTIIIAIGVTLDFIVTFINGGLMPISTDVINIMPLYSSLRQSIYAGNNGVYSILIPTQTLLPFLATNIPVPILSSVVVLTGFPSGLSIGTILLLIGIIGVIQKAMTLPLESRRKEETIFERREKYPVVEEKQRPQFKNKTDELFYEEEEPAKNPLDNRIFDEASPRSSTQIIKEITPRNIEETEGEESQVELENFEELEKLTRPLSESLAENRAVEEEPEEEAIVIEEKGFFVSQFNAEKEKKEVDTGELAEMTNVIYLGEPEEETILNEKPAAEAEDLQERVEPEEEVVEAVEVSDEPELEEVSEETKLAETSRKPEEVSNEAELEEVVEPEEEPEISEVETTDFDYSDDLLSALDSSPTLEQSLTDELEALELEEETVTDLPIVELEDIKLPLEDEMESPPSVIALSGVVETEEEKESTEEIEELAVEEETVIALGEPQSDQIIYLPPHLESEEETLSVESALDKLESGSADQEALEVLLKNSGIEDLEGILGSEIDMDSIIIEDTNQVTSKPAKTDIEKVVGGLSRKRGSVQEDERTGYIVTKAYMEMSSRDKSEEQMLDVWSQIAEENRERKLGRRRRASANYQTNNPYLEERTRNRERAEEQERQALQQEREAERRIREENSRHQEETAKTVNAQAEVDTSLMSEEERIAAGYEKVNFEFSGRTISFWRKKSE